MARGKETARKLGIFGGTFDPPHLGHMVVAQDACDLLDLDRLIWIPARRSPHREEPVASAEQRFRMVAGAVEGDSRFEASDIEIRRDGPSYTIDTVRDLAGQHPTARLYLIIGVDQWADFGRWREPVEIGRLAEVAVMARAGEEPKALDPASTRGETFAFIEVGVTRVDVSATQIRRRVADGLSVRYLVPDRVRQIIEADNLYL